jgi:hypothetical protein
MEVKTCSADKREDGLLVRCGLRAVALVASPQALQNGWPLCEEHATEATSAGLGLVRKNFADHPAGRLYRMMDSLFLHWCRDEGEEPTPENRTRFERLVEQW